MWSFKDKLITYKMELVTLQNLKTSKKKAQGFYILYEYEELIVVLLYSDVYSYSEWMRIEQINSSCNSR